jgi:hypothetical protein
MQFLFGNQCITFGNLVCVNLLGNKCLIKNLIFCLKFIFSFVLRQSFIVVTKSTEEHMCLYINNVAAVITSSISKSADSVFQIYLKHGYDEYTSVYIQFRRIKYKFMHDCLHTHH